MATEPISLMAAHSVDSADDLVNFENGKWWAEEKYDGERIQAVSDGSTVRLFSRNYSVEGSLKEFTHAAPEIVEELQQYQHSFLLDGEIIYENRKLTSEQAFSKMSSRMRQKEPTNEDIRKIPLTFVVFDIAEIDGVDVRNRPLSHRRGMLEHRFENTQHIKLAEKVFKDFQKKFEEWISEGREGMMLKYKDGTYEARRSKYWLKVVPEYNDDFVAIDWKYGKGKREPYFGAFLCQTKDGQTFSAGAGKGMNEDKLAEIRKQLDDGTIQFPIVVEINYKGTYDSGKPRMPRMKRIRFDKPVEYVKCDNQKTLGDFC